MFAPKGTKVENAAPSITQSLRCATPGAPFTFRSQSQINHIAVLALIFQGAPRLIAKFLNTLSKLS